VQVEEEIWEVGERRVRDMLMLLLLGSVACSGSRTSRRSEVKGSADAFVILKSVAWSGQEGQREGKWELNGYIIITGISAQGVRA
jgi:hypothetical protein